MNRQLRVALFSGNYNYVRDGANQALNRLVAYLEQVEGAAVRVYSPTTATPAFEPAGTLVPVPSVGFPGRSEYRVALGMPRRIRDDVRALCPDIIHLSAPDPLGTRAQAFARARGIPVVTSLHTRFETYFDYYGLGWLKPMIERRLARFYGASDYVLVPSQAIADEMAGKGHEGRIRIWSRGVDRACFNPAHRSDALRLALGYGEEDVVVLFFGRLVLEKGIATFMETIRRLRERGHQVRPLVVGDGPARARFAQLPNAVFLGQLAGEQLSQAVASADILLNPSLTEAFGNVVLEAMASGLAVVSADTPSAAALLIQGQTGILCQPDSVDDYASAVERLIVAPALRRGLGQAACNASAAWSWTAALASVGEAYRQVLHWPSAAVRGETASSRVPPQMPLRAGQPL